MVTVMRAGEEVKISKRAGIVRDAARPDRVERCGGRERRRRPVPADREARLRRGRDAVRFFLVSRKADTEFVFDVDLALAQSDENPVYYVQYAHARICSVLAQSQAQGGSDEQALLALGSAGDALDEVLGALELPREFALAARLAEFPALLSAPATNWHRMQSRSISRT